MNFQKLAVTATFAALISSGCGTHSADNGNLKAVEKKQNYDQIICENKSLTIVLQNNDFKTKEYVEPIDSSYPDVSFKMVMQMANSTTSTTLAKSLKCNINTRTYKSPNPSLVESLFPKYKEFLTANCVPADSQETIKSVSISINADKLAKQGILSHDLTTFIFEDKPYGRFIKESMIEQFDFVESSSLGCRVERIPRLNN